jgi:tetratricopeptide (TPR) repeat protein
VSPEVLLVFATRVLMPAPAMYGGQSKQVEVEQYSRQAQRAMAAKNWEEAAKALDRLLQLAPDVPEVQGNLGLVYYSQGRILDASKAFEGALKLNPRMARARLMLGLCKAELGHYEEAIAILEPAFRRPIENETARLVGLDLARAYAGLRQDANAAGVWGKLLRRYPNDAEILFQASRFYAGRSYDLMSRLLQFSPNSPWAHYATAEVHESLARYDLAIAEYRKVLKLEPRLPGIHFRIGRALLAGSWDLQMVDQALKEFQAELVIAPQDADAEYEIGEIERHRGNLESALAHFSKAVTYHRDFAEAHIGLARTLLSLGRAGEAAPHLKAAIRLAPQNDVPHFLLASVARALGDGERAQKEMALYQTLHAAGGGPTGRLPGTGVAEVSRQTIEDETGR